MKLLTVFTLMLGCVLYAGKGIELTVKLRDADRENFKNWLSEHADFKGEVAQEDIYVQVVQKPFDASHVSKPECARIKKKRRTYMVRDVFEVALDSAQEIGECIAIELKDGTTDQNEGRRKILGFLKEFNITEFQE